jgi:hypothetical protein
MHGVRVDVKGYGYHGHNQAFPGPEGSSLSDPSVTSVQDFGTSYVYCRI